MVRLFMFRLADRDRRLIFNQGECMYVEWEDL